MTNTCETEGKTLPATTAAAKTNPHVEIDISMAAWPSIEPASPRSALATGRVDQSRSHEYPEQHRQCHDHQQGRRRTPPR